MILKLPLHLSIAAPAYNEMAGIEHIIRHWHIFLKNETTIKSFEIVICNDGSQDETGAILDRLAKEHPEIRPIHFQKNQGAAAALTAAIAATQLDWILLMDSDDQFPIENLQAMLTALSDSRALAALGIRAKKDNWIAQLGSKASGAICNIVHGSNMKDFNSAFKLVYGPLLRSLHLEAKGMNYSTEITSRLLEQKINIVQVDIKHKARTLGKSHIKIIRDGLYRLLFVIYIALRQLLIWLEILRKPQI